MKRLIVANIILASFVLQLQAQDAVYIYRNDYQFNAFFYNEIDSITYSKIDANNIVHDEFVTQEIYTPDSIYRIPLSVIDSIGFSQPDIIYEDDVIILENDILNYIDSVDNMNITFVPSTPSILMPKIGNKLATVIPSEIFPLGFIGKVSKVLYNDGQFSICCDSISLTDVMKKFYGAYRTIINKTSNVNNLKERKIHPNNNDFYDKTINFGDIKLDMDAILGLFFIKKNSLLQEPNNEERKLFNAEAKGKVTLSPIIDIKISFAINKLISLSCYNINIITDFKAKEELELGGIFSRDYKFHFIKTHFNEIMKSRLWEEENKKLIDRIKDSDPYITINKGNGFEVRLPYGFFFYFDPGMNFSVSGEIGASATFNQEGHIVIDFTYYPLLSQLLPLPAPLPVGTFKFDGSYVKNNETNWNYLFGRINGKQALFLETGIGFFNQDIIKFGIEGEGGFKESADILFNWDEFTKANKETNFYNHFIATENEITITPYTGIYLSTSILFNRLGFKIGKEWDLIEPSKRYRFLPSFSDVELKKISNKTFRASSQITNDLLIPMKVGFSLYDENEKIIKTKTRENLLYWNHSKSFNKYFEDFSENEIKINKRYKVYPIIKLFDYNILASPSSEYIEIKISPVTLPAIDIGEDGAIIKGYLDGDTDYINTTCSYGFMYSKNSNPVAEGNIVYSSLINNTLLRSKLNRLEDGTTYYYCAFLCIDGEYTYGEIKSFKTLEAAVEVENLIMESASYYPNRYTYNGKKYSFKYNCITTIELKRNKNVEDWGYIYEDPDGSKARISCKNQTNTFQDDRYAYCRNESSSKVKLYGYVKYINKEDTCYGKAKEFSISYPVGSTITMTNSEFKGTETDVDYQGKTYKYKSTFRFPFTASGAYWLKVKTKEDGEGWNGWNNLPDRVMSPVDGTNALTVNYYYNEQMFDGDFIVYLYGNDETHTLFYKTGEYATLSYFNGQFTGCTYHSMAGNSKGISVSKKEKDEIYEFVIDKCF